VRDGRLLLDVRALATARSTRSPRRRGAARVRLRLMPLTVGTAGHIDHGKTWLVRALTGKDTDRLPEEQRRGISIDLGYAPLELPDGRRSRSSTSRATSGSSARWSPARPGSTSSCS
jgi:translation initiation factor 2 gamma subunit (eIF-2gamma)